LQAHVDQGEAVEVVELVSGLGEALGGDRLAGLEPHLVLDHRAPGAPGAADDDVSQVEPLAGLDLDHGDGGGAVFREPRRDPHVGAEVAQGAMPLGHLLGEGLERRRAQGLADQPQALGGERLAELWGAALKLQAREQGARPLLHLHARLGPGTEGREAEDEGLGGEARAEETVGPVELGEHGQGAVKLFRGDAAQRDDVGAGLGGGGGELIRGEVGHADEAQGVASGEAGAGPGVHIDDEAALAGLLDQATRSPQPPNTQTSGGGGDTLDELGHEALAHPALGLDAQGLTHEVPLAPAEAARSR
jgi:hypothetical protein